MRLTFLDISLIYIYLNLLFSRISSVPEFYKAFLSLPTFFLLPFLIGILLTECSKKILEKDNITLFLTNSNYYIFSLVIGIFFLESVAVIFQLLHLDLLLKNFGYLSLAIATLGFIYLRSSQRSDICPKWAELPVKKHALPSSLLVVFSIIPFLMKMSFVQPPLTTWHSWALPIAQVQCVLRLLNNGFFDLTQRWMEILLTAMCCQLFNVQKPEFFSYNGTVLVTVMLALGTYALTYRFSSKISISLLAGIISIFINAPIGLHEIPAYHFKSNTLLICLYPWVFLLLIELLENRIQSNLRSILSIIIPLVVMFGVLAFLTGSTATNTLYLYGISYEIQKAFIRPLIIIIFPLILMFSTLVKGRLVNHGIIFLSMAVLYTTSESDFIVYFSSIILFIFIFYAHNKGKRFVIHIFSMIFLTIIYLAWIGMITLPDIDLCEIIGYEKPNLVISNFLVKKIVFSDGNTIITRYFLVFGLISLIFSREKMHSLALGALTVTLFLFFFPDYWSNRGLGMTTPFVAFTISIFLEIIPKITNHLFKTRKISVITVCTFTFLFISILLFNLFTPIYTKFSRFPGSHLSYYEYEVAVWLRENTKETEVIISDYWTMMLLNPISNKIWLTDRQFMAESLDPEYKHLLENLRKYIFHASDSSEAYEKILALAEEMKNGIDWTEKYYCKHTNVDTNSISFIIVISPRTITWLKTGEIDVEVPQYPRIDTYYLKVFNDTRYFELLTYIPEKIYVFKVKQ